MTKLENIFEASELWHLEELAVRLQLKVSGGIEALNACLDEEVLHPHSHLIFTTYSSC
jgi:hypothetical protein